MSTEILLLVPHARIADGSAEALGDGVCDVFCLALLVYHASHDEIP